MTINKKIITIGVVIGILSIFFFPKGGNMIGKYLTSSTLSNEFGYEFGYVSKNAVVGFAEPVGTVGFTDQLLYNLLIDGYAGQPFGSCLQRSQFITNPTERAKCAAYENRDLAHVFASADTPYRNVLIKNLTIKNAFRAKNAVGGTTSTGIANSVTSYGGLPHTDTFQAYGQSDTAGWMVIQDTLIKNSDNGVMIVGDTKWKNGVVYQNLTTYCDAAFAADTHTRAINDRNNFIGSSIGGVHPCGNQIGIQMWSTAPVWLINVSSALPIGVDNPFRANNGSVIVVGNQVDVLTDNFVAGKWIPAGLHNHVYRYATIEQALAAGHTKPPFIELSCSGWGTPPSGCQTQQGYLDGVQSTFSYLGVSKLGNGFGTAISSPAGINCGSDCTESYTKTANTSVTLNASATTDSTFDGWSGGGCSGTGTCTVSMSTDKSVTATFSKPILPFAIGNGIQVTAGTAGSVNVRSDTVISPDTLLGTQANGAVGVITAGPVDANNVKWWTINYDSGADGWTGQANSNGQNNLTVTRIGNPEDFILTIQTAGNGSGTISGNDGTYSPGEDAVLTANASPGSTFSSWSGCDSVSGQGNKICTINMDDHKTIIATFTANPPTRICRDWD